MIAPAFDELPGLGDRERATREQVSAQMLDIAVGVKTVTNANYDGFAMQFRKLAEQAEAAARQLRDTAAWFDATQALLDEATREVNGLTGLEET
ncbi:MAG: hypothetical protein QM756_26520 [Polyangiaceae bacterium]